MFKQFVFLCIIISTSIKVRADLDSVAEKLIKQLKDKVMDQINAFHENSVKWLNNTFETVTMYEKSEEKYVNSQINILNKEIEDLASKRCMDEHKDEIAAVTSIGNRFNICSREIKANAVRFVRMTQAQVKKVEGRTNAYDKELADCANGSKCLKALLDNLQRDIKEFPAELDKHIHAARNITDLKINDLEKCSRVGEMLGKAEKVLDKIMNCYQGT